MRAVQLSKKSVEHYTPPEYVWGARQLMGEIDLDPASCALANTVVQATEFFDDAGLHKTWHGKVFLNPPGGSAMYGGDPVNQAALWWARLASAWDTGEIEQAFFVIFNLETLRYAQRYPVAHPLDFPICFPKDRIRFWHPDGNGGLLEGKQPAHPSAVVWLPRKDEIGSIDLEWRMQRVFGEMGLVRV